MTETNNYDEKNASEFEPTPPQLQQSSNQPMPRPRPATDPRAKSAVLAILLSAMPGLGQVYIGYYKRGFIHILVVAAVISFLAGSGDNPLIPLFALFLAFFWLYNMIDAGRRASLYNNALRGEEAIDPPSDFTMPGPFGAAVGGVCLFALGGILLSNTLFGYSLIWIEDWWPVGLFLPGIWLIFHSFRERAALKQKS